MRLCSTNRAQHISNTENRMPRTYISTELTKKISDAIQCEPFDVNDWKLTRQVIVIKEAIVRSDSPEETLHAITLQVASLGGKQAITRATQLLERIVRGTDLKDANIQAMVAQEDWEVMSSTEDDWELI